LNKRFCALILITINVLPILLKHLTGMRIPSLSRLFIAFLLVICIFVIVIFTGEDNERHSTQICGKFKKKQSYSIILVHEKHKSKESQSEKLKVLDPVLFELKNISDL
jgi:hypothetical protein